MVSAPHRMSCVGILRSPRALPDGGGAGHKAGGALEVPYRALGVREGRERRQRAETLRQWRNCVCGGHGRDRVGQGMRRNSSSQAKPGPPRSVRPAVLRSGWMLEAQLGGSSGVQSPGHPRLLCGFQICRSQPFWVLHCLSSRLTPGFAFSPQPWISPSTASKSWSS